MDKVTWLCQHRSGLLEEWFVTAAKERLAAQQKSAAEHQQMAAAEAEDYEMADQMSMVIEKHGRERVEYAAILENIKRALQDLDSQKSAFSQSTHLYKLAGWGSGLVRSLTLEAFVNRGGECGNVFEGYSLRDRGEFLRQDRRL
jgi:hypothetical protein